MTSRTKRITVVAGVLIAILLLILFFLRRDQEIVEQPIPTIVPGQQLTPTAVVPISSPELEAERVTTSNAQTVAKIFTERYGSFSNEANFGNIRDVLPLTTASYRAELEAYIASAPTPVGFYSVTTRLVSVKVNDMDDVAGTADFTLSTQRTEAKDAPQNIVVRYQDIDISLEKQGDTWLVSDASWK